MRSTTRLATRVATLVATLVALVTLAPVVARAQGAKPPAKKTTPPAATGPKSLRQMAGECKISDTAPWVVKQSEWFGEPGHPWTNDTLRTALLQAAGLPPFLVPPVALGVEFSDEYVAQTASAPALTRRLATLVSARGSDFPTKSTVGAAGMHAVVLLAHHDTGFAREVLHRLMEAGPVESPAADVATLEDRLRLGTGRKQIYGTQFVLVDGKPKLLPMEDSAHADLRREDAALPPLAVSVCVAKNAR